MEGVADEQRKKKVQAGRAKLAHFRQRKTKGEGSNSQKKTQKRKSSFVHDVPTQENSLTANQQESSVENTQTEELQIAVHAHDDDITPLSSNLEQTFQTQAETQEAVMFLSNRIQPLQLHLQETTKDKENQMAKLEDILLEQEKKLEMLQKRLESSESYVSVLKQELSERNLEVVKLQHDISIAVQTESSSIQRISEECGKNHEAEHRAAATEDSSLQGFSALIAELNEKLKQSETLRENLCKKLEEQMLQFEQERLNWEKQQKNIVTNLTLQLQHAEEQAEKAAAQNKEEKERLNEELRNLKDKLKTEAESSQALKWQHDKDVQSYILKLQTLEMEKEEMHQKLANYRGEALETPCSNLSVKYETFEHELKVDSFKQELEHLKKNLNRVKAKKDHENYEAAQLHGEENELSPEFEELTCLDKYLVPSSGYQMFEQSVSRVDSNDPSRFELDSDFMLEQSLNSTTEGNVNLLSSPMPISDVLAGGVSLGTMLDPESFAVYLSSNMRTPGKLNEFSSECDKNLAQRCTLLMEQLEEKEKQFQKCSETLEEMIGKWKAVTAELCTAKLELERKKSIQLGDYKEHQQIVEELHNEGDESRKQIVDQEQLVKETNKTCGEELCNDGDILKRSLPAKEDLKLLLEQNENLQKRLNDVEQELVRALEMCNTLQTSNTQLIQCQQDTEKARESDQQEFDNKLNLKGMEQQLLQEMIKEKEAEFFEREKRLCEEICTLKEVKAELETRLQEQIDHLNAGFQKSMEISEEDWRQQIDLLKQEHERELSQLCDSHKQELLKTCSDMKTEHELLLEELQHRLEESRLVKTEQAVLQAQSAHHMEMEALRLSLTNMHTAHLELSQTNLHKEKEDALVQLRERLNDKRAQEMAILQGRHQFDMKHLQDQHSQELDLLLSQHSQEMEKLREEQSLNIMQLKAEHCQEMEELQERGSKETLQLQEMYGRELEGLRQQNSQEKEKWEKEREQLEQRHQHDIAQLTETLNSEWSAQDEEALQKLRVELEEERKRYEELIRQNVSERSDMQSEIDRVRGEIWNFSENKAQQKALKNELDQQHQSQAISLQEETEKDFDYSIDEDQLLQVNELVSGYREVRSRQEFNLFWSQLDRTRASRQELNELKEQLLARSAQVEEIGRLKQDFEQQRMQMKADHEKELEELRIYFEQKSRESEENYREELEMLHQRLREMNDDDREDMVIQNSSALSLDDVSESERSLLLQQLTEQLEQHKEELTYLRLQSEEKHKQEMDAQHAALTLQYKEEVMNMKMALSDRYISEIEALKRKHSLEMEQLRARLSEEHIREITKLHLQSAQEAARQVETGVGEKEMEENYPVRLCLLPEKQQVLDMKETLEHPQRDHERDTKQLEMLHSGQLEKRDQVCQTELLPNTQDAFCSSFNTENCEKDSSLQEGVGKGEHHSGPVQGNNHQDRHKKELAAVREQMASVLEEVNQQLQAVCDHAVMEVQDRFNQECQEKTDKQQSLMRELPKVLVSGEHKQEITDLISELQEDEPQTCVLEQQKNEEELGTHESELQKHRSDLRNKLSELQQKHEQELLARVCELKQKHEEDLNAHLSELQQKHEEELDARVSELQQKHEEELGARVSELQQKHEEELGARVSELQQKHEKELGARVSELQQKHEEELGARVSELQQKHEEELGARVSELQQKHEEELGTRVSELQQKHEEELGARVSELQQRQQELEATLSVLQQKHEEELGTRVSELQQNHEEELSARLSELQQKHEEELGARVSELQQRQQELEATLSVLQQKHEEELGARVSELQQKHKEELGFCVSELQQKHEEELGFRVSELQQKHEEDLGFRVSELQQRQQELESTLSELQQKHEEELGARVSELQQKHEEELGTHVSELQQKHEEELGTRVSELQQKHEEELGARVFELQQRQKELEAILSELQLKHRVQIQQLETTNMSKLDSLESSYLSEIQKIRDEHTQLVADLEMCLAERLQEKEEEIQDRLAKAEMQWNEKHKQELQLEKELIRNELATVHMEKFQAMSKELEDAHMEDLKKRLEQQRCQLEEERSQALDVLREEVQRMEEQNHLAMQELRDLHRAEVKKQCLEQMHKLQEEADKLKEQLQNQEENLKERLDQQRCQLEQEKNLALDALHEEVLRMEEQHQTALQELRDLHKEEVQKQSLEQTQKLREELHNLTEQLQKQEIVMTEMNSQRQDLSEELQEKSAQHLQLQEEMELLKCHSEMLLEQQIIQLKEESDAERKSALDEKEEQFRKEEEKMQASHQMELNHMTEQLQEKSRQVLQLQERVSALTKEMETADSQLEVLMQRRDRENQEGENLVAMLRSDVHNAQQEQRKLQDSCQRLLKLFTEVLKSALSTEDLICKKIGLCLDSSLSQKDVTDGVDALTKPWDMSVFLKCSELSENNEKNRASPDCETMTEHSLMSSDEGCELSEYLCDSVLGSLAVGLENEEKILRMSQRLRTAVERLLEMVTDSTTQLEQTREVQQRFQEEFQCRNQEMAQIVIQNQELLKQLAQETEAKNQLQVELHKAQGLIEGYAAEKASMEEELSGKESTEHQLVVELEKSREQLKVLTQEPSVFGEEREVLLRLQEVLSGSVRDVEVELLKETERLAREKLELHCQAKKDRSNLLSQMKVLEMELEEQMSRNQELLKRTNEMTDLQQQIQSLEKQLKNQRHFMDEQAVEREHERDEFQQEIQKLEDQLKQALKNQVDSRTHGLHDWSVQIETLEAQVKEKADDCNLLLQGRNHLEHQIAERNDEIDKMMLRIQELEQATLSNAEAAKKCVQLEEELQKMCRAEKELLQDKEALQQQQYNNVLQISSLQSKLDEARHRVPAVGESDHTLKEQLQAEREALVRKEKEAESLAEQLEQFREDLMNKTEEVLQLNMQLEIQRKQSELAVQQVQEEYLQIKEEMSSLQLQKDQHKNNPSVELPQALLQEKNQEIDHLNEQLLRLQQEMERRKAAASPCSEVEELRSMVELLQSDQQRLRSDKLEEIEQLHEVIEKLQQELEQLTPNRHEVSDSQESLDQLGLGGVENLKNELRMGARHPQEECVTELDKAREDLQHFKVEVMTLQQQLEERKTFYDAEVEVLERNLLNLQESSRQQVQELNSLKGQHSTLQEENGLLRTRLSQKEAEVAILTSQLQDAQDSLRECEASLTEKQLLVQTLQEQRTADVCELENQLAQKRTSLEVASTELKELRSCNDILQGLIEKSSKEHSEREEKYKEEILELMEHVRQWEDKAQSLTTELQNRESQGAVKDQLGIEPETEHFVIVLKEQLSTTENLLREREAELHSTQTLLASMKRELSEMHTECERRGAKVEQVLQQLKKRDVCVAELQSHSQNLGAHVQRLQETLGCQGMLTSMSEELQKQSQDDKLSKPSDQRASLKHTSFSESLTDMSAWDSPDMVRKQEENVYSGRVYTPFSELSIEYSTDLDHLPSKSSDQRTQPAQYDLIQSSTPSLSGSNYSLTHSGTHRTSPVEDIEHTIMETVSSEDQKPSIDRKMSCEQSELDYSAELSDTLKSMLGREELLLHTRQNVDYMNSRGLSANLQNMLGMVHEESCKILALSERPVTQRSLPEGDPLVFQTDAWQKEKKNLQDAIQSLIIALTHAAGKKEKDSPDVGTDWRRELLQSVHDLLGSEAEFLLLELHTLLSHHGSGDSGSLSEKMEHVIKQQEEQKRLVLEHLLASDRSSLLSEIQDLRSQLRMAHLQNQEKLQQLQEILTSTEEKGSTREHQLRRQVELLEYKLQQEASIAEDLKASLSHEKERASEQYQLLLAEQGLISQLRMELEERRSEQEKLMKSQKEFEMEISRLRDELVSKEQAVSVCMQTLQMQQDQENQKMEEKKVLLQKNQDRYEKSLQDLSVSLEELRVQNNKLSAALQHEQTCSSNLRKELQIEQSRCEALLAQERSKLTDTEQELEKVRQNLQSLSSTLTLERNMMEKLKNQHTQELSVKEQERLEKCNQVLTLRSQLEEERSRSRDWAVMTEKVQEQAVYAKRQLESEVQASQEEIRKEREATIKLRAMLESLQSQQQQMNSTLDKQRERESLLQKERDQYQARLLIYQEKERSFVKEIEKEKKRAQETEAKRVVGEEREKRILDLQLQHERDQRRIQELQHMLADLEEQERALFSRKSWLQNNLSSPFKNTLELRSLTEHTSRLEKVWQQLFHAVLQVQEWLKNSSDRILPGCPGEEAITSLLDTLSELKSELQRSNVQPPAESSFSSVDALRSENVELSKSVTVLKQEKLELRSQLAKLETLHQALQREMAVNKVHSADAVHTALEAERAAWHREKRQLQSALKHAESELCKMTSENRPVPDVSNSKMQRLYKRYLRAESFRKALVYQKKYLLLLLGGFQACEKATLSLIAQMGVYPSPADLQVSAPCQPGLTKFRSAVRAVIAISRLKFLVRKWHKISRKGGTEEPLTQSSGLLKQGPLNRIDILHQQQLGSPLLNSPPTRDVPLCFRPSPVTTEIYSPKTSYWKHSRLGHSPIFTPEQSPCTSQDPEHSITEYIRHLELVQQRLGGLQNGSSPELSHVTYIRK